MKLKRFNEQAEERQTGTDENYFFKAYAYCQ